jgi:hypothetical protein
MIARVQAAMLASPVRLTQVSRSSATARDVRAEPATTHNATIEAVNLEGRMIFACVGARDGRIYHRSRSQHMTIWGCAGDVPTVRRNKSPKNGTGAPSQGGVLMRSG